MKFIFPAPWKFIVSRLWLSVIMGLVWVVIVFIYSNSISYVSDSVIDNLLLVLAYLIYFFVFMAGSIFSWWTIEVWRRWRHSVSKE